MIKPTYDIKCVIDTILPEYNDLGNGLIRGRANGLLPIDTTVTFGYYIRLTSKIGIEGIYPPIKWLYIVIK